MHTKTKGLLMQKLHQHRSGDIYPQPSYLRQEISQVGPPVRLPKRTPTHISHVNQYNFMCIVNKKSQSAASKIEVRELQVQNLRLVEEKVKLTEWLHNFTKNLREGILHSIQAIQQFRYLEGVNLLHHFLQDVDQAQKLSMNQQKSKQKMEENSLARAYANPQSKNTLFFDLKRLQLSSAVQCFTYFPKKRGKEAFPLMMSEKRQQGKDDLRMLLVQSRTIQDFVLKYEG